MTGGLLSNRWTANNLSQNFLHSFSTRQFAAQRCFKCQKFGHGKNACRGRETCATCGHIGHTSSDCTNEPKCPRSGPTKPVTRSIEVQTDLTLPKGQEVPSVLPPSASSTSQRATQTTTHKLSSNTTGGPQASGKRQSSRSPPTASSSNKNYFNKPHGKPPDTGQKKPRLSRPPNSDSEIPTSNMFNSLYTEAGDGSSSESDCTNPS